jgi:hypothetical protein
MALFLFAQYKAAQMFNEVKYNKGFGQAHYYQV